MSSKVQAKILYNRIKEQDAGLYVFVTLDEVSLLNVGSLLSGAPVKVRDSTELHCTVMHCKSKLPLLTNVPDDRVLTARIVGVNEWIDHKNRKIWTLALESADLHQIHNTLRSQGIEHSFDEYNPHIGIAKDVPDTPEAADWLEGMRVALAEHKPTIRFDGILRASTCD